MANKNDVLECPAAIQNRSDAMALWKHLLSRGIAFHWEDDPSDIIDVRTRERVLTSTEARNISRLYDEVAALCDEWAYEAALSLSKLTLLVGREVLAEIPLDACDAFQTCGSERAAVKKLATLVSPERPTITRIVSDAHARRSEHAS